MMSNPLRVKILGAIATRPSSKAELSAALGVPLATVEYHTNVLCNAGCARPVAPGEDDSSGDRCYEADR